MNRIVVFAAIAMFGACNGILRGADWPQFRGADRDGISYETDLLEKWPENGPEMIWSARGNGIGYSSVAVAHGSIYTTGLIDSTGYLFAYDLNGKLRYKVAYGPEWTRSYKGARVTPTVDGDRLYIYSGYGVMSCHKAETGRKIWSVDTLERFEAENIRWSVVGSPLVDANRVYCTPGGEKGLMVALDRNTGQTIWATDGIGQKSTYASPILVERGRNRILIDMVEAAVIGVNAENGRLLWQEAYPASWDTSSVTPVYKDGEFFVTNIIEKDYVLGGTKFALSPDGTSIEKLWNEKTLDTHHGGVVLVDGYLYGSTFDTVKKGGWACVNWETGKLMWYDDWYGSKGSIISADGMLYCYDENDGHLALVKASPKSFDVVSSFEITLGKGSHWAHPAISDGVLYIRHGEYIMAFDIRAK